MHDLGVLDPRSRPAAGTARAPGFQQDHRGATSAPGPGQAELRPSREHSPHPSLPPAPRVSAAGLHTGPTRSSKLALSSWPAALCAPVPNTEHQGTHTWQREEPPGQPTPHKDFRSYGAPAPSGNTGTSTALFTLSLTCTLPLTKWRLLQRVKRKMQHSPVKVLHNLFPRSSLQSPQCPFHLLSPLKQLVTGLFSLSQARKPAAMLGKKR